MISRSSSEIRVPTRRPVTKADIVNDPSLSGVVRKNNYSVDPTTGKKVTIPKNETYVNSKGKTVTKQEKSTKMFETDDAHTLSSGTAMEKVYGDYANSMKALGDQARQASVLIPSTKYSPSAKAAYADEVASLKSKLAIASSNKPMERQAQLLANSVVSMKRAANPDLTNSDIKKIKGQALEEARLRTGAKKQTIEITDKEWEAIQAGAISQNTLTQILNNADLDAVKQLATPRSSTGLSAAKIAQARALLDRGYTLAEVAEQLGVSVTTINNAVKGD